nr:TIGR01906 family membrane protein [Lactobacillus sp.]
MIRSIWIERVILLLFGVILFFFVLSLAISITINSDWLYYIFIKLEHLDKKVFLTSNELWHEYKTILYYLNFPWIETLHTKLPLSVSAIHHFEDVKKLFEFNYIVLLITSIMIGIMWRRIFTKTEWWNLLNLFKVSNIIILMLVCIVCLDFSNAFIVFHQLLFNNRDWIF